MQQLEKQSLMLNREFQIQYSRYVFYNEGGHWDTDQGKGEFFHLMKTGYLQFIMIWQPKKP